METLNVAENAKSASDLATLKDLMTQWHDPKDNNPLVFDDQKPVIVKLANIIRKTQFAPYNLTNGTNLKVTGYQDHRMGTSWPAYHTSFRRDLTNHIRQISLLPQLTSRSLSFTLRSGLPCSLSVNRPPPPAKGHTRSRFCPTQTRGLQSRSRRPRIAANYPTYTLRASVRHPQINPNPACCTPLNLLEKKLCLILNITTRLNQLSPVSYIYSTFQVAPYR